METTQIEQQKRGQLTNRIKEKSIKLFGYEMSQKELRLIPYIQYILVNEQKINIERINNEEMAILSKWVNIGYILEGVTCGGRPMMSYGEKVIVTKEFWESINEILWLGYVDLTDE